MQEVHADRDGWLFLVGGTNRVRTQYRAGARNAWRLLLWRLLVARRAARARALGLRYLHAVVPEKVTVYADRFPGLGLDGRLSPARRLGAHLPPAIHVDLVGALRAARDDGPELYFRTDSHWTHDGCLVGYRAICRAIGIAPREDLADRPFTEAEMVRDLGSKLVPPRTEVARYYTYLRDAERAHTGGLLAAHEAAGRAEALHVGAHAIFRNARAPSALRLVLFGDSCSHFGPFALTAMLAETVAELHFVWSASLDWGLIERLRPDVLLFQMAERFMARVPKDRFDLEVHGAEGLARFETMPP